MVSRALALCHYRWFFAEFNNAFDSGDGALPNIIAFIGASAQRGNEVTGIKLITDDTPIVITLRFYNYLRRYDKDLFFHLQAVLSDPKFDASPQTSVALSLAFVDFLEREKAFIETGFKYDPEYKKLFADYLARREADPACSYSAFLQ